MHAERSFILYTKIQHFRPAPPPGCQLVYYSRPCALIQLISLKLNVIRRLLRDAHRNERRFQACLPCPEATAQTNCESCVPDSRFESFSTCASSSSSSEENGRSETLSLPHMTGFVIWNQARKVKTKNSVPDFRRCETILTFYMTYLPNALICLWIIF